MSTFSMDEDNSVSSYNFRSGQAVGNADIRAWRNANRKGGDFVVFSNLKVLVLAKPDTFTLAV